jgi:hypothetical protein
VWVDILFGEFYVEGRVPISRAISGDDAGEDPPGKPDDLGHLDRLQELGKLQVPTRDLDHILVQVKGVLRFPFLLETRVLGFLTEETGESLSQVENGSLRGPLRDLRSPRELSYLESIELSVQGKSRRLTTLLILIPPMG